MPTKPKNGQPATPDKIQNRDQFQTPDYATDLIVPYLTLGKTIWEPCAGQGKMVKRLQRRGFIVHGTTLSETGEFNALEYVPEWDQDWQIVVTNPPFSLKAKIVKRFIDLDKPFAFLIPGDWAAWMIRAMREFGCELLVPTRRISYITPNGKQGKESAAQFHSVWLTRYLQLPSPVTFVDLTPEAMLNI